MRAIGVRARLEMTGCALARSVMVALRRVAGEAQAAIGDETRDRRLAMAGIARHVRVYRIRMGCPDVTAAVAARAVLVERLVELWM